MEMPALLKATVDPARLLGAVVTVSVPTRTRVPALVKLERVRLKPARVRLAAPELIVRLEIETAAVSVGMLAAVETMSAESRVAIGTPVSQLRLFDQTVLVPPHQVRSCPAPPKSQFLLLVPSIEVVAVMVLPDRASESLTFTLATLLVLAFKYQAVPLVVERRNTVLVVLLEPKSVRLLIVKVELAWK